MRDTSTFEPASPEYVLETIRDSHRHQCAFDPEAVPDATLSFDTSIAEWRDACDLVNTKALGTALNEIWGLNIPSSLWQEVLDPPVTRTLRNVCDLISSQAQRPTFQPSGFLGASSSSAGAFLAVRALLLRAGADPSCVRPSAPIAEMTRSFPHVFLGPISALAPGCLPTVAIRTPARTVAIAAVFLGFIGSLVFSRSRPELATAAVIISLIGYLCIWPISWFIRPAEVRFGAIVTFRDLAEVIAGEPRSNPALNTDAGAKAARAGLLRR